MMIASLAAIGALAAGGLGLMPDDRQNSAANTPDSYEFVVTIAPSAGNAETVAFGIFDEDDSGEVTFEEFVKWAWPGARDLETSDPGRYEALQLLFLVLDSDSDGRVQAAEFATVAIESRDGINASFLVMRESD